MHDVFDPSWSGIIVCAGGFLCVALAVLALVGGIWLSRRNASGDDEAALRREVARLQAEVDRLTRDA